MHLYMYLYMSLYIYINICIHICIYLCIYICMSFIFSRINIFRAMSCVGVFYVGSCVAQSQWLTASKVGGAILARLYGRDKHCDCALLFLPDNHGTLTTWPARDKGTRGQCQFSEEAWVRLESDAPVVQTHQNIHSKWIWWTFNKWNLYHCSYHGFVAVFAAWVEGKPEIWGFSCGALVLNLEETTVLDAQRHLKNDDLMVVYLASEDHLTIWRPSKYHGSSKIFLWKSGGASQKGRSPYHRSPRISRPSVRRRSAGPGGIPSEPLWPCRLSFWMWACHLVAEIDMGCSLEHGVLVWIIYGLYQLYHFVGLDIWIIDEYS